MKEYLWVQGRSEICWNALASVADIHSSLRLVGYYWLFVEEFLKIAKPITELLGKDKKFKCTPTCEASLKEKQLTVALVLVMLDMEKPFSIY
jgi:hypothetical protein